METDVAVSIKRKIVELRETVHIITHPASQRQPNVCVSSVPQTACCMSCWRNKSNAVLGFIDSGPEVDRNSGPRTDVRQPASLRASLTPEQIGNPLRLRSLCCGTSYTIPSNAKSSQCVPSAVVCCNLAGPNMSSSHSAQSKFDSNTK